MPTLDVYAKHLRRTHQEGGPVRIPPHGNDAQVRISDAEIHPTHRISIVVIVIEYVIIVGIVGIHGPKDGDLPPYSVRFSHESDHIVVVPSVAIVVPAHPPASSPTDAANRSIDEGRLRLELHRPTHHAAR